MTALRIALAHPYSFTEVRRGGERYVWDLAWYLGRQGHHVEVITGTTGPPATAIEHGVTFRSVPQRRPRWLGPAGGNEEDGFALALRPALLRARFDLVHAFTPQAAAAARLSGHRVVFSYLGAADRRWVRRQPAGPVVLAGAAWSANVLAALSRSAADLLHGLTRRRPIVLPPGIRTDVFAVKDPSPPCSPTVLFASDASYHNKAVDVVLAAIDVLAIHRGDVRLLLAGPGDHRWALPGLGERAEAIARRTDVLGVGRPEDLPLRYRQASVTVLPSVREAFGLVLLESLASGTPVVCADTGGPPEIVDSPYIGRTFRAGDATDLARALDEAIDLAADPLTPTRCAAHAARWGWTEAVGPAHERVYQRVARSRRRPGNRRFTDERSRARPDPWLER